MDDAYDLGIYVYCGQHEITAMQSLEGRYPKRFNMREFGTLSVFEERTPHIYHMLRMAGNFHNKLGETRQHRTWIRIIKNLRVRYDLVDGTPFTQAMKVSALFVLYYFIIIICLFKFLIFF